MHGNLNIKLRTIIFAVHYLFLNTVKEYWINRHRRQIKNTRPMFCVSSLVLLAENLHIIVTKESIFLAAEFCLLLKARVGYC